MTDVPPPREIPLEEKILRDRKEKQIANQLIIEQEKKERLERELQNKKNAKFAHPRDIKNKKITYDHHGKVMFVKTIKSKQ